MSIRLIAKELYRLRLEKERLEERLKRAPSEEHEALEDLLRQKRADLEKMQNMLVGAKEPPKYRRPH